LATVIVIVPLPVDVIVPELLVAWPPTSRVIGPANVPSGIEPAASPSHGAVVEVDDAVVSLGLVVELEAELLPDVPLDPHPMATVDTISATATNTTRVCVTPPDANRADPDDSGAPGHRRGSVRVVAGLAGHGTYAPAMSGPADVPELAGALATALGGTSITELRRLSGVASRETWSFLSDAKPLILQRTRPGASLGGPTMATEDGLLAAAAAAGVPVPPVVVDAGACEPILGPARITAFVAGEALGPRIVRDERYAAARSVLVGQCGQALAAIHSIDRGLVPELEVLEPLERLRIGLDLVDEHRPALELALRWLADHRPEPVAPAVVHGDFRVGNLLVDDTGLRAVLDWELAHAGDPAEDLAWFCLRAWRFGGAGEAGGVGTLEDLLASYNTAAASPIDVDRVHWWMVGGTLTWALICGVQAHRHLDGHVRSVELATIGRRICESEHDLLDLLGVAPFDGEPAPGEVDVPPAPDGFDLHGRPTAAELAEAIEWQQSQTEPDAFQSKVAANARAILDREHGLRDARAADAAARLARIGHESERSLAESIRSGTPLDEGALTTIRALVTHRVEVANPKWLRS
jgi:aminoglycoside phosphotransferase (APT) family kinase protein